MLPGRKSAPLLTGLSFFGTMCFHQLAVLAYPALALSVYLQSRALPARRRVANVVWFSLSALVLIVAAYALAFYHATAEFSVARLLRWTLSYSPDADTHFGFWSNLGYSLRGQVRLFFGGRLNLLHGLMKPGVVLLIALLVIAVLLLIIRLLWKLPALKIALKSRVRLEPQQKLVLWLALVWLATYLMFLFLWLPQNTFVWPTCETLHFIGMSLMFVCSTCRRLCCCSALRSRRCHEAGRTEVSQQRFS